MPCGSRLDGAPYKMHSSATLADSATVAVMLAYDVSGARQRRRRESPPRRKLPCSGTALVVMVRISICTHPLFIMIHTAADYLRRSLPRDSDRDSNSRPTLVHSSSVRRSIQIR